MGRLACALGVVLLLSGISLAADKPATVTPEDAIRKALESYVEAYNRGDAAAMAGQWSRDGEYVSPSGERFKGRDKIRQALQTFFEQNKGIQAKAAILDVELTKFNRAVAKGVAIIQASGQEPDEIAVSATLVKERGDWKIASVEETESPVPVSTMAHLGQLEWLIGDWVDKDEQSSVETAFRWNKDYSFISGSFQVNAEGRTDVEGTQVIGWDPVEKKIRSWIFDSKGGFGEGVWTGKGNSWTVRVHSVLASGQKASAINIYTYVDPNTFTWQSIGRELDGVPLPNIPAVTVVRKETQPARRASGR
jgi:uncharacterized protein (TIGR02246 family)